MNNCQCCNPEFKPRERFAKFDLTGSMIAYIHHHETFSRVVYADGTYQEVSHD